MPGCTVAGKNMFRLVQQDSAARCPSHTLQAIDEHDKRMWMQCLRGVLPYVVPESRRPEGDGAEDEARVPGEGRAEEQEEEYDTISLASCSSETQS